MSDKQKKLTPDFFSQPTEVVAEKLIGKVLYYQNDDVIFSGRITETEAYLHQNDFACHAANGKTDRNSPMFAKPGTIYVYKIYGIHYCLNFSTLKEGLGCAVLLRAIKPILGVDKMLQNRQQFNSNVGFKDLCNGPGKLCQSLGIDLDLNMKSVFEEKIWIEDNAYNPEIIRTKRIGINKSKDLLLRFLDKNYS